MRSYLLVAAVVSRGQLNHVGAKAQPARLPRRLQGYPACCVEHSYWGNGEVNGTTCYAGRSPWDAATMTDLCTAGYSEAGEVAPPFRDCRQEAIDSGNCGTGDWDTCAECVDHNVGSYFANVGYASCPDWVVDAMNAEAENGGQCAEGLGGVWTCPTCDGWCSCQDCPGPDPNACDWNCDESRSEPTWGGTKEDCSDDDDDDDDSVGKIIGPIVAGVVIVTAAIGPWVYCHMRKNSVKKAAEAPPPMVEAQVLGTVVSETSSTEVQVLGTVVSEPSSAAATAWAEGTVESGPLEGAPYAEPVPSAPPAEEMPAAAPLHNWEMPPPAPPRNFCSACGALVQGPFCGQCGARA